MSEEQMIETPEGLAERLLAEPARSGLFLDFDGTLAPIVDDPRKSAMPERLRPALGKLAGKLGVVAVCSGRPADFLIERVQVPGVLLLGLYGLQEAVDGEVRPRPEAAAWEEAVDAARRELAAAVEGRDGLYLEDKGLAVAVHYRHALDAGEELEALFRRIADETGLHREPGKRVEELRPPVDWDKGAAVGAVTEERGLDAVTYLGDDLGDLVAFEAARARGGVAAGVDHGEETPDELRAVVSVLFEGTEAVADWLEALAGRL